MLTGLRIVVTSEECGGKTGKGRRGLWGGGYIDILYLDWLVNMVANICK